MKKLFLIITSFALTTGLLAQEETAEKINYGNRIFKGVVLLNGGISFQKTDNQISENKTFLFQVGSQFAVSNHLTLDVTFGYQSETYKNTSLISPKELTDKIFVIIPGISIFGDVSFGWLQPYLTLGIPIGFGTDILDEHYTSYGVLLSPGLNVYLSKRLALTASMGLLSYQKASYKDNKDDSTDNLEFSFTPNDLRFGVTFLFGTERVDYSSY